MLLWDGACMVHEAFSMEKLIDLLHVRYGEDIKIVLAGNSWGGFLGFAFLLIRLFVFC